VPIHTGSASLNADARAKLIQFIAQYGSSVIDHPARCEGLLRDHFENRHYEEERAILAALHHGSIASLRALSAAEMTRWNHHAINMSLDLHRKRRIDVAYAQWALESWALALRMLTADSLPASSRTASAAASAQEAPGQRPPSSPTFAVTPASAAPTAQPSPPVQAPPRKSFRPSASQLSILCAITLGLFGIITQCTPQRAIHPQLPADPVTTYVPLQIPDATQLASAPSPAPLPAPEPEPAPENEPGSDLPRSNYKINSIGMRLALLPAGSILMGSPRLETGRNADETQSNFPLNSFWIGTTEVTRAQWKAVLTTLPEGNAADENDNLPVQHVSFDDAMAFCKKLGEMENAAYTLPTEAQWEYACRAGTSGPYNWGRHYDSGNVARGAGPVVVAHYPPNRWGLYDMHANVAEWCISLREPEPSAVLRGGSWNSSMDRLRSASRHPQPASSRNEHFGFRVVTSVAPSQTPTTQPQQLLPLNPSVRGPFPLNKAP
jgi:formylglycine-generating enzyme required for sulfatase activity